MSKAKLPSTNNVQRHLRKEKGVTAKAILVALALIPINCYWVMEIEIIRYAGHPTIISIFFTSIFSLFLLLIWNLLSKKIAPILVLSRGEMLVVYIMLNLASGLAGHDTLQVLVPILGHPFWFATPENEWKNLFFQYIPSWLSVSDKSVLRGYYEGEKTLYTLQHIRAWMTPVLWWTGFLVFLLFLKLCINIIVRKQWTEKEKLSYPSIQLPLEMTNPISRLFSNRLMWIGFAIAAGVDIINGLHVIFPNVPALPVKARNYGHLFTEKPLNAIGWLPIAFYPSIIGIGFFIPLDLSFSFWVFFWVWKAQSIFGSLMGLTSIPRFPFAKEQASGGYLAFALIALWMTRKHLAQVGKKIIGQSTEVDDSKEPMGYRTTSIAFLLGFAFLLFFCVRAGMLLWVAILFFVLYLAMALAVARMRAELGAPMHSLSWSGADWVIIRTFGTGRLGTGTLTLFPYFWVITTAYRPSPMAHQLEGFKMAERVGINSRLLVFAMILAAFAGSLGGFWALLHRGYEIGMVARAPWPSITHYGQAPWAQLQHRLLNPSTTDAWGTAFMGVGFVITFLLFFMRMRFLWWSLHPIAYALTTTYEQIIWFPIFLAWLAKLLILRYGGLKSHRRAVPFFLGLILGEFIIGSLWSFIGVFSGIQTYTFFP